MAHRIVLEQWLADLFERFGAAHKRYARMQGFDDRLLNTYKAMTSLFLSRGPVTPKGFDQPIQVYEVLWSDG